MLRTEPAFRLSLIVTGQHLTCSGRSSLAEIVCEGFTPAAKVDLHITGTSEVEVARALGTAVSSFAEVFESERPDLLVVLGDRYEMFGAVQAAMLMRIPVAHLCGGDVTEGAVDDAMRHAITKMSHLHFVSNADAAQRVLQMGEEPTRIHLVGSPGLDRIREIRPMERDEFFASVGLNPCKKKNAIVTFHPATLSGDSEAQCAELLAALDACGPDLGLLFTGVNLDVAGDRLQRMIDAFVCEHPGAVAVPTLGSRGYLSAMTYVDVVIGNSSSGLYEAPSFGIATVNVGDRQAGRLKATSVIDCAPEREAIRAAIARALAGDWRTTVNPYGDGHASERIAAVLRAIESPEALLKKRFHMIDTTT